RRPQRTICKGVCALSLHTSSEGRHAVSLVHMSALPAGGGRPSPLDAYREVVTTTEGVDEVVTLDGVREPAEQLAQTITDTGLTGLLLARSESRRFVADEGITYGGGVAEDEDEQTPGSRAPSEPRTWQLDPVPLTFGTDEWARLERGVRQRAVLLDQVLTDLTGPQRLV